MIKNHLHQIVLFQTKTSIDKIHPKTFSAQLFSYLNQITPLDQFQFSQKLTKVREKRNLI